MKYRRLQNDELQTLEKDFIDFLASQSIPADTWEKMDKKKKSGLVDIFSDMVFDKVLEKVILLERIQPDEIHLFYFDEKKIVLRGLKRKEGGSPIDFTKMLEPGNSWQEVMHEKYAGDLNIFRAEKKFAKPRKEEIFYLLEHGCKISELMPLFEALQEINQNLS